MSDTVTLAEHRRGAAAPAEPVRRPMTLAEVWPLCRQTDGRANRCAGPVREAD